MNAKEQIYALALASNLNAQHNLNWAITQLEAYGVLQLSHIFEIPCRNGVGRHYLNCACLMQSVLSLEEVVHHLKKLEKQTGRIRPSHKISLDIDLIAWQVHNNWHFNHKKMPFALDVQIPMSELIKHSYFEYDGKYQYKMIRRKTLCKES